MRRGVEEDGVQEERRVRRRVALLLMVIKVHAAQAVHAHVHERGVPRVVVAAMGRVRGVERLGCDEIPKELHGR